jgi:putative phosphoribosyl transferase
MRFHNRQQAGRILSEKMRSWSFRDPLVLALPRGGVPVAFEIAKRLEAELDLLLVKKIGMPGRPELALGAIAEEGEPYWNAEVVALSGLPKQKLNSLARAKLTEISEQSRKWRAGRPRIAVKDRTVILVDDGLATGATMIAAIEAVRRESPKKIVVAVPVASAQATETVRALADEVLTGFIPEDLWSVGLWYEDFTQVEDEEVTDLLQANEFREEEDSPVEITDGEARLPGRLIVPPGCRAVVIFAHGSGSTHKSPRNLRVASALHGHGFATLLFDLLTEDEAAERANVFNVELLARRLSSATKFILAKFEKRPLPIAYFGASTGAAAALAAAAGQPSVFSVVSRGGRPDLAQDYLHSVKPPVLLLVGSLDRAVIPLNDVARGRLSNCEMTIVPGASHLFEEPGALDKVIEYSAAWFDQCQKSSLLKTSPKPVEEIVSEIRRIAKPIAQSSHLDPLLKRMSEARVVMLGEATHGTEEFYELRRIISQRLIEDYGFKFIAVEGDWPDCFKLTRYIFEGPEDSNPWEVMRTFRRWPTWMWANHQTAKLIEWLKGRGSGFYGLDVYSLYESLKILKAYAAQAGKDIADKIDATYACFEPYERSEINYAAALVRFQKSCEAETVELLREMARARLESSTLDQTQIFDARQNALILRNAERYYRSMVQGDAESWNIRDTHMMETLDMLLQHHGEGAKGIVWAHNTHIGDYKATDMASEGYVNLGGLARERYGSENVFLTGFGTYEGQVLAGHAWDADPEVVKVHPAREGSIEFYLHKVAGELEARDLFLDLSDKRSLPSLGQRRGHRAIGVVYQSNFELHGRNYVPTSLTGRYDAFVFSDKTSALRPVPAIKRRAGLLPETWPSGQ